MGCREQPRNQPAVVHTEFTGHAGARLTNGLVEDDRTLLIGDRTMKRSRWNPQDVTTGVQTNNVIRITPTKIDQVEDTSAREGQQVVLLLFAAPWLSAAVLLLQWLLLGSVLRPTLAAVLASLVLVLAIRLWSAWRFGTPIRYWWLSWLGALLIAAIVPASIWKTTTGRGWTWRGRQLEG